jgi:hypothetical protein
MQVQNLILNFLLSFIESYVKQNFLSVPHNLNIVLFRHVIILSCVLVKN